MSGDAGSLRCPSCGAPAPPDARQCAFCTTRLAAVACPSCFALMFDQAAHCPACGARRERAGEAASGLSCPGCAEPLQAVQVGSTRLLECDACGGIWADADVFERLCADQATQAAVLHHHPPARRARRETVQYRRCARCGTLMNRVNFGRVSGTIVDVCRGHGTFLDAGELHRIVEFIRGGGLERARARQIEDLRQQEQRLRRAEARIARRQPPAPRAGSWNAWRVLVGRPDAD